MFAGALEALDRLQANPETILAVATGKGYKGAITLLESHGIIGRFHSVQTPDHNRGKPDPQMIESCMAAGANAYHVKPVQRAALIGALREQIAARRATVTKG